MIDPELDDLLRRYRPTGPPPDLRARVLAGTVPAGRTWPWVAAAAVLLAATVGLQVARLRLATPVEAAELQGAAELRIVAEMLGGGERAVDEARRLLWERDLRALVDERAATERVEQ